jgi:hypothetical protein
VLTSPEFLFRVESDPEKTAAGGVYRVSDLELASRLSFFLWSSIPDDELLDAAIQGKLRQPAEFEKQDPAACGSALVQPRDQFCRAVAAAA